MRSVEMMFGCRIVYQGRAEAERFPGGDVPLAVVEEELTEIHVLVL